MAAEKRKNENKRSKAKTLADEFLGGINKDEIVSNAQRVISSAVNVLEEEIAAGILAAKKIENKVLDVDDLRSDPDDLMNRIRRDTHEAVDLFLDALTALSKQVTALTNSSSNQNGEEHKNSPSEKKKEATLTVLETDTPIKPGETVTFKFTLFENEPEATNIQFQRTDLFGPNKQVVSKRAIKVNPKKLTLKPKNEEEVRIILNLPKNAEPGMYSGMITDMDNTLVKVILNVEVTE